DLTRASHALESKHHFHRHRRNRRHLAAGFAHFRGIKKTIAATKSTAAAAAEDDTAHSANAAENGRATGAGIFGGAWPGARISAAGESPAAHANSTAATRTGPTTGINAALRQTGIPHLAGTGQ